MKTSILVLAISALVVTVIAITMHGQAAGNNREFPLFAPTPPLSVFSLNGGPERVLCVIENSDTARNAIKKMADRYPSGWKKASRFVSFAPSYRVKTGDTEILLLKHGLIVSFTPSAGGRTVLAHSAAFEDIEALVRAMCENAK